MIHKDQSPNSFGDGSGKYRQFILNSIRDRVLKEKQLSFEQLKAKIPEDQIFFLALKYTVATNSMVCEALSLKQKNCCRYKRRYEEAGLLAEVKYDTCIVTGFDAWYLTTDEDLFPTSNQLTFFDV